MKFDEYKPSQEEIIAANLGSLADIFQTEISIDPLKYHAKSLDAIKSVLATYFNKDSRRINNPKEYEDKLLDEKYRLLTEAVDDEEKSKINDTFHHLEFDKE